MSKGARQGSIHTGSSFQDFLEEEGMRNEVEAAAIKRVLAWQFEQAMEEQKKTKQVMAKELRTSRSQLDRLLDPANTAVSLETLTRAATVLGKQLVFEIRDHALLHKGRRRAVTRRKVIFGATATGDRPARDRAMTVYKDSPYTLAAEKYRPKRVRVLFVAEAPPSAVERYFFYENVDHDDWLWIALMKGLYPKEWRETKTERARKRDWLRKFQENEFWLVDAVKAPLSGSHAQRVRGISSAANGLIEQIQRIAPHQIVLIKATVHDALFQKLKKAGLSVINDESLPFPSSGQQARFHAGLRHLVNTGRL